MCTCLRSIWARSTWPSSSSWPLCSYSLSYEYLHAQHAHRTLVVVCGHWPYVWRFVLFPIVSMIKWPLSVCVYISVDREKRIKGELSNGWPTTWCDDLLSLFLFYKVRIREKKELGQCDLKSNNEKKMINSSEEFFFYRKLFKIHQSYLKIRRFSIQLIVFFSKIFLWKLILQYMLWYCLFNSFFCSRLWPISLLFGLHIQCLYLHKEVKLTDIILFSLF
jgi:hypothetical protein